MDGRGRTRGPRQRPLRDLYPWQWGQRLRAGARDAEPGNTSSSFELFKDGTGDLVDWTAHGIHLEITNVPAPFGNPRCTLPVSASYYYRIKNAAGHTMGFRMVLRVDNNCCDAAIEPITGLACE